MRDPGGGVRGTVARVARTHAARKSRRPMDATRMNCGQAAAGAWGIFPTDPGAAHVHAHGMKRGPAMNATSHLHPLDFFGGRVGYEPLPCLYVAPTERGTW